MLSYLGRSPLYNRDYVLYGYDVLHRDNVAKNNRLYVDKDRDLLRVFTDAISVHRFDELSEGLPVHFCFTKQLLMSNLPFLMPPDKIVVELYGENINDAATINKLRELNRAGYKLALGGLTVKTTALRNQNCANLFDYIYLNVHIHSKLQLIDMFKELSNRTNAYVIAEQVDTEDDFDKAIAMNFKMYQGLLFGMPSVLRREVNLAWTPCGKLFNLLAMPKSSVETIVKMLMTDKVLRHLCLGYTYRARSGINIEELLSENLTEMGMEKLRKWSCVLILKLMNLNDTLDISRKAYCRGLFMEKLLARSGMDAVPFTGFLLGVFSLMSEVTDTPMESLLSQFLLDDEVKAVLLRHEENIYSAFLDYAVFFEREQDVPRIPALSSLSFTRELLTALYRECQRETNTAFLTKAPLMIHDVL